MLKFLTFLLGSFIYKEGRDYILIQSLADGIERRDEPSLPFKMECTFIHMESPLLSFIAVRGGSEKVVIRAKSEKIINWYDLRFGLRSHSRLLRFSIYNNDELIGVWSRKGRQV